MNKKLEDDAFALAVRVNKLLELEPVGTLRFKRLCRVHAAAYERFKRRRVI